MDRAFKIGIWFALAAVVGLVTSSRSGDARSAPSLAKGGAAAKVGEVAPAAMAPRR